jgi:RNA polymerase sigma-70 factor (ECF subfamily)
MPGTRERRFGTSVAAHGRGTDTRHTMRAGPLTIDPESDEALMLAYAGGSSAAFDRLYARHRGGTYRYLLRHTGNAASAEEMHQDVWLKIVRARDGYSPDARFTTWLYTIARHRLVDHWRSQRGLRFTSLQDEGVDMAVDQATVGDDSATDPLSISIDAQCGRRLVEALATVPPAQRDAFLLHVEAGFSLPEIAALTSTSAETVKSRLRYAYRRLRAVLEDLQ